MILGDRQPLPIAAERERTGDGGGRKVVRGRGRFDAHVRPFKGLLLDGRNGQVEVAEIRLIEQRRAESVSVSEREIPHAVINQLGEASCGRPAEIRNWEGYFLVAVCREEPTREFALSCVQVVQVNDELVFVEARRDTKSREPLEREALRRIDRLRRRNHELPVREFKVEQGERRRADVGAVGRHRYAPERAGLTGKQLAQGGPRAVVGEGRREEAARAAPSDAIDLAHALVREEKQQLVFLNGAAEGAAELVLLEH